MRITRFTPVRVWVALLWSLALASCATPKKYELTTGEVAPAPRLDYQAVKPSAELTLTSVIVCKGPGSWKQDARWDEYVVHVANRTGQLLRIESVVLVDFQGQVQPIGWDPWQLENQSATNWAVYRAGGTELRAGAGAENLKMDGGKIAATDAPMRRAGPQSVATLHDVVPAEFVHDARADTIAPGSGKDKIMREFARRRLFLPVTLPPGGAVEGSLFFPMTPGPQRLVLNGRYGEAAVALTLELQPLAALHFRPPGEPKEDDKLQRMWSWVQKSWDETFGGAPKAKVEK